MKAQTITLPLTLMAGIAIGSLFPITRPPTARAESQETAVKHKTVWYFYRIQWGHQDEFIELYRKNHYPVLKAQLGDRIVGFKAYKPTYHGDGRADWTFATVLTFRDAVAMTEPADEDAIARRLFPDLDTFHREERHRFEILDAHWDVPLTEVSLE